MGDDMEAIADLLQTCLRLSSFVDEGDVVGIQELTIRDHLIEILSNFSIETSPMINENYSYRLCDMRTYIDSELSLRFELSTTDLNFEMCDLEAWSKLILGSWNTVEYALSLQIIISLVHISILNKMSLKKLEEAKSRYFKKLLVFNDIEVNEKVKEKSIELFSLILTVSCEPIDIFQLYNNFQKESASCTLNSLAAQLSDALSQNYLQFENCYKIFRSASRQSTQQTFQLFIELNNVTSNRIMTIGKNVYLEIKEGQFCISNDEFIIALFTEFEFERGILYSIAVVLDNDNILLYVSGNCVGKISLFEGSITHIEQSELGSMICSFKLFRFLIFNDALREDSIKIIHTLGSMMRGSLEKNLGLHNVRVTLANTFIERITSSSISLEEQLKDIIKGNQEDLFIDLNPSEASFSIDNREQELFLSEMYQDDTKEIIDHLTVGKCFIYTGADLLPIFTSVNCFRFILCSLENASNIEQLFNYLSHLMTLLQNSHLRYWFQKEFGFPLLSHILSTKMIKKIGTSLPIQFLNLFQEYCGWDFSNITKSFINDENAYHSLVLNLDLWYSHQDKDFENVAGLEIIRFLFFQISSLLENSKYQYFNSEKLKSLNILERLCNTQHLFTERYGCPNVLNKLKAELSNVYYGLLKENFNKKNVQWLLQFSYFELKNEFDLNSEISLNAVDTFCIEMLNKNDTTAIRIFSDSVSPKFLVMLLDEVTIKKGSPLISLNILLKLLLVNKPAYKNFIKNGGFDLILHILRGTRARFYEDIIYLLYHYALGDYELSRDLKVSEEFQDEVIHDNSVMVMKELLVVALELLEWAVINDIRETFPLDLESFICIFLQKLSCLLKEDRNFASHSPSASSLFRVLQDFLITLTKPQNSLVYTESSKILTTILGERIIYSAGALSGSDFERFLEDLTSLPLLLMNSTSYREKRNNYFELSFVNSILPNIVNQLNSPKYLHDETIKDPHKLSNFVLIFEKAKPILIQEIFAAQFHLDIFQCLLELTRILSERHGFRTTIKNALADVFSCSALVLTRAFMLDSCENRPTLLSFYRTLHEDYNLLFDVKYGAHQVGMANSLIRFLILRLEDDRESDDIFKCLKSVALQHKNDLKTMSGIFSIFDSSKEQSIFLLKLMRGTKETLIEFLRNQESFGSFQKEQFIKIVNERLKLKNAFKRQEVGSIIWNIAKEKQFCMELKYSDAEKKYAMFHNDNVYLNDGLQALCSKHYTNFVTDMEEDIVAHNNQYNYMKCQFDQILALQLDKPAATLWGIDSVQDHDMRQSRLVPFRSPQTEIDIDFSLPTDHIVLENRDKKQDRKASTSMLSYDLISDFESIDLSSNEKKDQNRKVLKVLKENDSIRNIWNTSFVVGLDSREGILIFGMNNLYFVRDYFFLKEENKVLNLAEIADSERDINVSLITGYSYSLDNHRNNHEVRSWSLTDLIFVAKRPFLLRDAALELLMENGTNCFFSFKTKLHRDEVYYTLDKMKKNENIDPVLSSILQELNVRSSSVGCVNGISKASFKTKLVKAFSNGSNLLDGLDETAQWQRGEISNFYYLIILNILAGRTFNDITQYPVFPWVIADYTSEELDLDDPKSFRDFSKPMGAQSRKRESQFIERFEALKSLGDPLSPPFHYGTHYSSAMIVSSYLIRLKPYVDSFLLLQGGTFGHADRLFNSIERAWSSAAVENTTDVRELIPEFFFLPEFLININNYNFGKAQNGKPVTDVTLPPWAKDDPKIFIQKNREALESAYVSSQLHLWIDLIFGFKQRGENAISTVNVFNSLSYPGAVNLDNISDENERRAITGIIHNFGQTPLQIFQEPHPSKHYLDIKMIHPGIWVDMSSKPGLSFPATPHRGSENAAAKYIKWIENTGGNESWKCYPFLDTVIRSDSGALVPLKLYQSCGLRVGKKTFDLLHFTRISAFSSWKEHRFVTGDQYGLIKVWEYSGDYEQSRLEHLGSLYGHLSEIKDLKTNEECNIILSVDMDGFVYLWDMINYQIIRKIPLRSEHIAISENNGTVAVCTSTNEIYIYNSSGMLYVDVNLSGEFGISCLEFLEFSAVELGLKRHIYWKEKEILAVGFMDGTVRTYELMLNEESKWELKLLMKLDTTKKNVITCIKTQLKIYSLDNGDQNITEVPKMEVVVGDSQGDLYSWR